MDEFDIESIDTATLQNLLGRINRELCKRRESTTPLDHFHHWSIKGANQHRLAFSRVRIGGNVMQRCILNMYHTTSDGKLIMEQHVGRAPFGIGARKAARRSAIEMAYQNGQLIHGNIPDTGVSGVKGCDGGTEVSVID